MNIINKERPDYVYRIVHIILAIISVYSFSCQQRSLQMKSTSLEKDVFSFNDDDVHTDHKEEKLLKFECDICSQAFQNLYSLNKHVQNVHEKKTI